MTEADNNTQGQKVRYSKLAIASAALMLMGCEICIVYLLNTLFRSDTLRLWVLLFPLLFVLGFILGGLSLYKIAKADKRTKGAGLVFISMGAVIVCFVLFRLYSPRPRVSRKAAFSFCIGQLRQLSVALGMYNSDNAGRYPTANKWCDLLLEGGYVKKDKFKCPANKEALCSYAINPHCTPNSPPYTILLFETTAGWNQHGGPEIMTFDNHVSNKRCCILCNGGSLHFFNSDELKKLKWKDDQKQ